MRNRHKLLRVVLIGVVVAMLAPLAPLTVAENGDFSTCEKGCFKDWISCAIDSFISCFQQHPTDSDARLACIKATLVTVCKPVRLQCLADCRMPGTEEAP